ncbi:MAG TPA: stalk domain-containing protein [Abditibacteriaceae bacterium]|nr:stalk domain-containing protein [Abditibacteriaceae bacterium]
MLAMSNLLHHRPRLSFSTSSYPPAPRQRGGFSTFAGHSACRPACRAALALIIAAGCVVSGNSTAYAADDAIIFKLNGHTLESDPPPVLRQGVILVPLRGVLEQLGAKVTYDAADRRIDIKQDKGDVSLRIGQTTAVANVQSVKLSAAPQLIANRAFVPLRSLAEIFGYQVSWIAASRTVAISSGTSQPHSYADHRTALKAAGVFGVTIDFHDATPDEVIRLLNAARKSGAGIIKTRFDWDTIEPTKGSPFQWVLYDRVVREARLRNLIVAGVLGNSAHWASVYSTSNDPNQWRNGPPRQKEYSSWQNYVRRTVGRYGKDVHAWQIWENPASSNFRSAGPTYRIVSRLALEAVRQSDPKAIVLAAESGGINLGFIEDLRRNGLTPLLQGVTLYPVSQWQPGVLDTPEAFVQPLANLRGRLLASGTDAGNYWIGSLAVPALDAETAADPGVFATTDEAVRTRILRTFTPLAQADYLTRAMTVALAAGSPKVFWGNLRDDNSYERVEPINPDRAAGLLRRDFTPRPSFEAFQTLTRLIKDKPFAGALANGPDAVALVFDNGQEATAVAWALDNGAGGTGQLVFNSSGTNPQVPNSVYIATRPGSQVLDSTGAPLAGADGTLVLSDRPVWITKIAHETIEALGQHPERKTLRLALRPSGTVPDEGPRATFGASGGETGLRWRKYADFRGAASKVIEIEGRSGLVTEVSRDPYNPGAGRPYIFMDVDDDYMYFAPGVPVTVSVEVRRNPPPSEQIFAASGGFNLQYDSPRGFRYTRWQTVESGEGWATYTFDIPDASFANRDGFDLMINTFGSKQDLMFGSVVVKRVEAVAAPGVEAAAAPGVE